MKLTSTDSPKPRRALKVRTAQTEETTLLDKLEAATADLLEFEHDHQKIFLEYHELQQQVAVIEDEVKTYVKQNKRNLESKNFLVEFNEGFHRWYDANTVKNILRKQLDLDSDDLITASRVVVSEETVDEKKLKWFCKLHNLDLKVLGKAQRAEPAAMRATIKRKA